MQRLARLHAVKLTGSPRQGARCRTVHDMLGSSNECARSVSTCRYEDAITTLNSLQSNAAVLREASEMRGSQLHAEIKLAETRTFLELIGISLEDLSKLSVIHISGTKGKGSTGALSESMLRQHGFRTGFYSSPHLVVVRERIRINGKPISMDLFTENFWKIYNTIINNKSPDLMMPPYFKFLTIMAFKTFLDAKVDVAVIEVGIGGEYDYTNILPKVSVAGITSLGIDHIGILGNTISSIAWHKAGILKPSAVAFTVHGQRKEALKVLAERSVERKCPLQIAPPLEKYGWPDEATKQKALSLFPTQQINAALSLQLVHSWMSRNSNSASTAKEISTSSELHEAVGFDISSNMAQGLFSCQWPGRNQVLKSDCGNITYFIDGAHTQESMQECVNWFNSLCLTRRPNMHRALLCNVTGQRDIASLLKPLLFCNFEKAIFSPNIAYASKVQADHVSIASPSCQVARIKALCDVWNSLSKNSVDGDGNMWPCSSPAECVHEALSQIQSCEGEWAVLVTGSLHLVGAVLSVLDPKLEKSAVL